MYIKHTIFSYADVSGVEVVLWTTGRLVRSWVGELVSMLGSVVTVVELKFIYCIESDILVFCVQEAPMFTALGLAIITFFIVITKRV